MAISLTCECGKRLTVKDELAGKRVKCPGCATILTVPSFEEEAPVRRRSPTPSRYEEDDEETGPLSRKKKSRRADESNKLLWIGAGAGVLVLGFCCLGVAGGMWYFLSGDSGDKAKTAKSQADAGQVQGKPANNKVDNAILGTWAADPAAKKNSDNTFRNKADRFECAFQGIIEFRADGSVLDTSPLTPIIDGKWRSLGSKSPGIISIEMTENDGLGPRRLEIKVIDTNHLRILEVESRTEVAVKRQ
jgi:hypothetical protein